MLEKQKNSAQTNPFSAMEEDVLSFWEKNKIFEKSIENPPAPPLSRGQKKDYVFYDGPPFATGTPHYGHIVASIMKDVVPRYWTMRGFSVERRWGWDCHGLPIENIVEKEMGSKSKKDIEKIGVDKFNELCRSKVLGYVSEWEKVIRRLGRWADMKNSYKTMDLSFMESVWWVFKELYNKGLIYEGYRSMHVCPRCETTLSQQEVAEGYKDIKDLSAIAKFELVDEPGTFVLAWTTTPWTLIGNVALAVEKSIKYQVVSIKDDSSQYIIAKKRIGDILKDKKYETVKELKGKDLIGKKYKPLFDYYAKDENLENREQGWKIYGADFVTTDEGTGVVHIAPAFGEDDMNLGKKENLPFIQHVGMDGIIKKEAVDFAGLNVKPSGDHMSTDIEIIKYLAHNNLLFSKEKYEHSYPHCWRCDTPLINYATSSWFVKITGIKDKALKTAKKINWSPEHIKEGRFGKWLEGARDWSISRQRFWASVIPIWVCDKCDEKKVVGSVEEIREQFGNPNKLFLVRHGEAEHNVKNILHSDLSNDYSSLTEKGIKQIEEAVEILKSEKIKIIYSSPFQRTKKTAQIISEKTGAKIILDERLKESGMGKFDGVTTDNWSAIEKILQGRLDEKNKEGVETYEEIEGRLKSFLEDINRNHKNENIVVISHGDPLATFRGICESFLDKEIEKKELPGAGKIYKVYSKYIDLHKHIVDKITFKCEKCSGVMKRVPDVLDTWFDSGSMPYAQMHYPFENKEKFEKNFPAEFIAEGIDQTRAWFYYLHTIANGIKDTHAFKNVIVNGIVLAEDGKKMSKKLNNYPDPMFVFDKYGADALRYYLLTSPVMLAENLNFSEKGVQESLRNVVMTLWNVFKFYEMYVNNDEEAKLPAGSLASTESKNILDKWILTRLNQTIGEITDSMNSYNLVKATRPIEEFVNDFSTWYLRRSRDRFKDDNEEDKKNALETTAYVLLELAKTIAPFMPFMAENLWQKVSGNNFKDENKSVHLEEWPEAGNIEHGAGNNILDEMEMVRKVVELGLAKRDEAGIKVRQPLQKLEIRNLKLETSDEFLELIKDELNVKQVVVIKGKGELSVELDTKITSELKLEGVKRELVRFINNLRKDAGLTIKDRAIIYYETKSKETKEAFEKLGEDILKDTLSDKIVEGISEPEMNKEVKVNGEEVLLGIKKV